MIKEKLIGRKFVEKNAKPPIRLFGRRLRKSVNLWMITHVETLKAKRDSLDKLKEELDEAQRAFNELIDMTGTVECCDITRM